MVAATQATEKEGREKKQNKTGDLSSVLATKSAAKSEQAGWTKRTMEDKNGEMW